MLVRAVAVMAHLKRFEPSPMLAWTCRVALPIPYAHAWYLKVRVFVYAVSRQLKLPFSNIAFFSGLVH